MRRVMTEHDPEIVPNERCRSCKAQVYYKHLYDAKYCRQCNQWLESACLDFDCVACNERPFRPLDRPRRRR